MLDLATDPSGSEPDAPDDAGRIDVLLEVARGEASSVVDATVVVGVGSGGGFEAIHSTDPLPAAVRAALAYLAALPELEDASSPPSPTLRPLPAAADWSACRHGLGGERAVVLAVAQARLHPLAAARLDAIALDLARAVLVQEARQRREQLGQLLTTARRVAESLELDTVLASIVEDATVLLGADSGDMLLWDRAADRLRVVAVSNFPPDMLGFELAFGEGLSSQAITAQRTIEVPDYATYEHAVQALDRYDFGSVLCAPLLFRGEAIGAINVHARGRRHRFDAGADDLLAAFAGHAAIAIDHARRYENEVNLGRELVESNAQLSRLLTVQQRLAAHVLLDGSPAGIASVLAQDLARDIAIQDDLHRLIAGAAADGGEGWRDLVDDGRRSTAAGVSEPFTVAVRVGTRVAGYLLLSSDVDLGPIDRALVDAATTGVALAFAKLQAGAEVEERLRGEAIGDLLSGNYPSEDVIAVRAARLGTDLGSPHDLIVVRPGDALVEAGTPSVDDPPRRGLEAVRERLAARAPRSVATLHGGSIVVLVRDMHPGGPDVMELAHDLQAFLGARVDTAGAIAAVGERCTRPNDYGPAFREAAEALELLHRLGRRGGVVATDTLGPYRLLLRASSREDLEAFARGLLGPLAEHDRKHGADLLRTLRAYLAEDRAQRRTAARCYVHVNTIVYRVRRIEEILRVDLGDPATVFDLTLALRILDLLDDPPADA